jgi:hypothetical protein
MYDPQGAIQRQQIFFVHSRASNSLITAESDAAAQSRVPREKEGVEKASLGGGSHPRERRILLSVQNKFYRDKQADQKKRAESKPEPTS